MTSSTATAPLCELPIQLAFRDVERDSLAAQLGEVSAHPYREYAAFTDEVAALAAGGEIPDSLLNLTSDLRSADPRDHVFTIMQNCPIDRDVPVFSFADPVGSKHALKTTFVAEGFLALFAALRGTPAIGYINVNDGDVFQDIYPKESLQSSQSQKALDAIHFHKDLANHFVRPDYVNMLAMRTDPSNRIFTTFVRNADALRELDEGTLAQLRRAEFHTPFDDLTVMAGSVDVGEADVHPVLSDELDLRFFENRTRGLTDQAESAIRELVGTLHRLKKRVMLMPGDFMSEHNNFSIHAKAVEHVANPETQRTRWIIKTVNVESLDAHRDHYLPGRYGIVNG